MWESNTYRIREKEVMKRETKRKYKKFVIDGTWISSSRVQRWQESAMENVVAFFENPRDYLRQRNGLETQWKLGTWRKDTVSERF